MKSAKRWAALALALGAVAALMAPSLASASRLESSKGILAKVGTPLTMTGYQFTLNTGFGAQVCPTTISEEVVTVNDGKTVEGAPSGPGPRNYCGNYGLLGSISNLQFDRVYTSKSGSGTASISFTSESADPQPVVCHWSGASLPFSYALGGASISFTKAAGLTSTGGCGSATLSGAFEVKYGANPVILN